MNQPVAFIDPARDRELDLEAMAVEARTFVPVRHVRQPVSRLEAVFFDKAYVHVVSVSVSLRSLPLGVRRLLRAEQHSGVHDPLWVERRFCPRKRPRESIRPLLFVPRSKITADGVVMGDRPASRQHRLGDRSS